MLRESNPPELGKEDFHETEATSTGTDHQNAAVAVIGDRKGGEAGNDPQLPRLGKRSGALAGVSTTSRNSKTSPLSKRLRRSWPQGAL